MFINKTNFLQDLSIQHGKTSCEDQIIICCIHIFLLSRGFLQLDLINYICIFSDSLRDCIYLTIQYMYFDEKALTTNFISDTTIEYIAFILISFGLLKISKNCTNQNYIQYAENHLVVSFDMKINICVPVLYCVKICGIKGLNFNLALFCYFLWCFCV